MSNLFYIDKSQLTITPVPDTPSRRRSVSPIFHTEETAAKAELEVEIRNRIFYLENKAKELEKAK